MNKKIKIFIVLMLFIYIINCYQIKNGFIVDKYTTQINYNYYKEEITERVPYLEYNPETKIYETHYKTIYTREYRYYKKINNPDYIIKIKNNYKDEFYFKTIYIVNKSYFNNIKINNFIELCEINYYDYDFNNETIEISKNEYLEGIKND